MENSVAVCGEPVESMPHVSHARVFARDSQLTTDPRPQFAPQWSPDGKQIAFTASERGNRELRVILAEGGADSDARIPSGRGARDELVARWQ